MVRAKKENKARGGLRGCDLQRTVSVKADSGVKTRGIVGVGPVDVGGSSSRQKQVWLQEETSYVRGQGGRSGASPKAGQGDPKDFSFYPGRGVRGTSSKEATI